MRRILEMEPSERPRERLLKQGVSALSDAELIAVLMRTGTRGHGAVEDADRLLQTEGGLAGLARLEARELLRKPGFGPAKVSIILAARELGERLVRAELDDPDIIDHPKAAGRYLVRALFGRRNEVFGFVSLDSKNRVIELHELYRGTKNQAPVQSGEVFRAAILDDASSILLYHNHPSGDTAASADDLALTRRLVRAGAMIDVAVVDHLIIAGNQSVSLRERNPSLFCAED